ncbi:hypothetical protein L484_017294 [Morus notabilis]|uniref:Uncharacterized protein n=1 Tax=Morus notabilis TaxID=981085 RepID=W9S0T6_9ROSA|nr:hypothetical protein L484_017294 [Morus notabilis]
MSTRLFPFSISSLKSVLISLKTPNHASYMAERAVLACRREFCGKKLRFKAVLIDSGIGHSRDTTKFHVQIISSETSKWTVSVVSAPRPLSEFSVFLKTFGVVACNQMLYWFDGEDWLIRIEAFDMFDEIPKRCHIIDPPVDLGPTRCNSRQISLGPAGAGCGWVAWPPARAASCSEFGSLIMII